MPDVAAVAGGIMRDVLIGDLPPAAIKHIHYFLIAVGGGLLTFFWYPTVASRQRQILLFDAVGLALFAVLLDADRRCGLPVPAPDGDLPQLARPGGARALSS